MAEKVLFSVGAARKIKDATQRVLGEPQNRVPGGQPAVFSYCYLKKGILDETLEVGSTATMSVWIWDGSEEVDNDEDIEVADWFEVEVAADTRVVASFISGRWYVTQVACE